MDGLCACGCGRPTPIAAKNDTRAGQVRGQPIRFVNGHNRRRGAVDYAVDDNGCWIWQRAIGTDGYGRVRRGGKLWRAHRWYYERHVGPIGDGLVLDHLCSTPLCINPAHMEPVTQAINLERARARGRMR
jgi:hypothetical protein